MLIIKLTSAINNNFYFTGAQFDDKARPKSGMKVLNPPGGKSQGLW